MSDIPIIWPKFTVGQTVDYVYNGARGGAGPGGQYGQPVSTKEKSIAVTQPIAPFAGIPGTTGPAPGGGFQLAIPDGHSSSLFQKAIEESQGARRRAVVDAVLDDNEYRLMLRDGQMVWAHASEVQTLDAISKLGDVVGPGSKTVKDLLPKDAFVPACADCGVQLPNEEDQHTLNGIGRVRCKPCFVEKLTG